MSNDEKEGSTTSTATTATTATISTSSTAPQQAVHTDENGSVNGNRKVAPPPSSASSKDQESGTQESQSPRLLLPKGTTLYWRFEIGSFWGQVIGYCDNNDNDNEEDNCYETSWNDETYILSRQAVHAMQAHAAYTLRQIPNRFENGIHVKKYFENDGGWWNGTIVGHDANHNYTIQWWNNNDNDDNDNDNGTMLEQWDPLNTVAMVQDAEHFKNSTTTTNKKKKNNKGGEDNENKEDMEKNENNGGDNENTNEKTKEEDPKEEAEAREENESSRDRGVVTTTTTTTTTTKIQSRSEGDDPNKKEQVKESPTEATEESNNNNTTTEDDENDDDDDDGTIEIVDPVAFPPTEEGLAAFLRVIDHGESAIETLDGHSTTDGTTTTKNNHDGHSPQEAAVYHATNVSIGAAATREFPIPIFAANSTVEFEVKVEEHDVKFAIYWQSPKTTNGETSSSSSPPQREEEEEEDLVPQHFIYASSSSLSATTNNNDNNGGDEQQQQQNDNTTNSNSNANTKGSIVIDKSVQVPTTLFLEFDNAYSWFTAKTISYKVTVNSPAVRKMISRATHSVPLVLQALQETETRVALQTSVYRTASKQVDDTFKEYRAFDRQVESRQKFVKQAQDVARDAKEQRLVVSRRLEQYQQQWKDTNHRITEIDDLILQLQQERMIRTKEQQTLEQTSIPNATTQLQQCDSNYQLRHDEAERVKSDMCDLQIEILTRDQEMADVEKARDKANAKVNRAKLRLAFLKRQAEELQKRLANAVTT